MVVFSLSIIYVCVLAVVAIVQLSTVSQVHKKCECFVDPQCDHSNSQNNKTRSTGGSNIFFNGCRIKTPFCTDMLRPKCNCASFDLEGHSLVSLSKRFVELTALRKVRLTSGPLKYLPPNMEKLNQMSLFDVSFNQLRSFDVDLKKWDRLVKLLLMFNNITEVHSHLWKHQSLVK